MTTWSNGAVFVLQFAIFCAGCGFFALLSWIDDLSVRIKRLEQRDKERG